jgi:hypothetical protein
MSKKRCFRPARPLRPWLKHALVLAALLLVPQVIWSSGESTKTRQITIVHSNNLTGHLFACPT